MKKINLQKYIFGATSAIITNLAIVTGMHSSTNAKTSIIGSLMVIALADNISDSLGIHIYQETEDIQKKEVWIGTFTNFFARLLVSFGFIMIVLLLPIEMAVTVSVIYGLLTLALFSYIIAKMKRLNPVAAIFEHIVIATIVIIISNYLGTWIITRFHSL
jgi:VIT1/CCC1 family predicted Fe2+/Mn2+ transporter